MATTLLDLRTKLRALVGDPLAESNTWSDTECNEAINFAVLNYCEKTDCSYTEEPATFSVGEAPVPSAYIRIERVIWDGVTLDWSDKDFEDAMNRGWRNLSGTPKRFMVLRGNTIRVVPYDAGNQTIGYIAKPVDLVADDDEVDTLIPEPHHPYLIYAAAAWLLGKDGDAMDIKKAQEFMQVFNNLIGATGPEKPETKE